MNTTIEQFINQNIDTIGASEDRTKSLKVILDEAEELREAKKLEYLADNAEDYAMQAIVIAKAMIEEAKTATSVAINTRQNAEVAAGSIEK
jgi:phage gp46-like protein